MRSAATSRSRGERRRRTGSELAKTRRGQVTTTLGVVGRRGRRRASRAPLGVASLREHPVVEAGGEPWPSRPGPRPIAPPARPRSRPLTGRSLARVPTGDVEAPEASCPHLAGSGSTFHGGLAVAVAGDRSRTLPLAQAIARAGRAVTRAAAGRPTQASGRIPRGRLPSGESASGEGRSESGRGAKSRT
jgi:hypothetical protein